MAVAAGICVSNIYYNQPLLEEIALSCGVSESVQPSAWYNKQGYFSNTTASALAPSLVSVSVSAATMASGPHT